MGTGVPIMADGYLKSILIATAINIKGSGLGWMIVKIKQLLD